MLNGDVDEILFDGDWAACVGDKVRGRGREGDDGHRGPFLLPQGDPKEKVKSTGKVVNSICFLNHLLPQPPNTQHQQQRVGADHHSLIPPSDGRTTSSFAWYPAPTGSPPQGIFIAIRQHKGRDGELRGGRFCPRAAASEEPILKRVRQRRREATGRWTTG